MDFCKSPQFGIPNLRGINAWKNIQNATVRITDPGSDVSVQRSLDGMTISKSDGDLGDGTNGDPNGLKMLVNHSGNLRSGEQHGSRYARVGSGV